MIGDSSFHYWCDTQALMNSAKVVISEIGGAAAKPAFHRKKFRLASRRDNGRRFKERTERVRSFRPALFASQPTITFLERLFCNTRNDRTSTPTCTKLGHDWPKNEPSRPYNGTRQFDAPQEQLSILVKKMLSKRFLFNDRCRGHFYSHRVFSRLGMFPDYKPYFGAHSV